MQSLAVAKDLNILKHGLFSFIRFTADGMFTEPTFPDASFTFCYTYLGTPLGMGKRSDETDLDHLPAVRIIVISRRQSLNAMHMIRQNHPCIDPKRPLPPHQQIQPPLQQIHREEIRLTRHPKPPIIRHIAPSSLS
jgi:hypothetical protein